MTFIKFFNLFLFFPAVLIISLSVLILISIDSFEFPSYFIYIMVALFFFILFANIDYRIYKSFDIFFYFLSLTLLTVTLLLGNKIRGSTRWLDFGIFSLQTSELLKPFLILSFANFSDRLNIKKISGAIYFFAFFSFLIFLVFKQPDLGNAIIYLIIMLSVFYFGGGNLSLLLLFFVFFIILIPVSWHFLKDYQKQRIYGFLNPSFDPLGVNYNLIQSVVTVGSGQLFGRGLGLSTQSNLRFLPERSTDFIFAAAAEQIGFVGMFVFFLIFIFFLWQILKIGVVSTDKFARTIVFSGFIMIFSQSFINMAMNLGVIPVTGVTLPLVSQGGSSLISTMIILGIISNISVLNR